MDLLSAIQTALPAGGLTDFIVDPIVDVSVDVIDALGYAGVFVLMLLESACLPVPSEAIMLFAGFNVAEGDMSLFGIVVAGVLGNVVGSWVAWGIGYYGRMELLEKNRLIHINHKHLDWADRWFERHGDATVFFTRMLPIIRTFISLPAGIARMPFWRFTVLTLLGCIPWVLLLGIIGQEVGSRWEEWRDYLHYGDYVVLAGIVGLVIWLLLRRRRGGGEPAEAGSEAGVGPLTAARAALLGGVQGPTELLPVSSSAHLALIPWAAGWDWERLDPETRKSFEIALHAGTAVALLIGQRREIARELAEFDRARAVFVALSFAPPAVVGYAFERRIEGLLGGPASIACGLAAGSVAMVLADRRPQRRGRGEAGAADGLALGLAQASALMPGVSRNGATLTAARLRGFNREHANLLSRTVALPVIVGATLLKAARWRRRGLPPELARPLAIGVAASFASTMASQRLISLVERDRAVWPYAAYRLGLATAIAARMRR